MIKRLLNFQFPWVVDFYIVINIAGERLKKNRLELEGGQSGRTQEVTAHLKDDAVYGNDIGIALAGELQPINTSEGLGSYIEPLPSLASSSQDVALVQDAIGLLGLSSMASKDPFDYRLTSDEVMDGWYAFMAQQHAKDYASQRSWYGKVSDGVKGAWQYVTHHKGEMAKELGSLALDFVPVVGQAKAIDELWNGRDRVTGDKANRFLSALTLIPGGKLAAKTFKWLGKTESVVSIGKVVGGNRVISSGLELSKGTLNYLGSNKGLLTTKFVSGGFHAGFGAFAASNEGNLDWNNIAISAGIGALTSVVTTKVPTTKISNIGIALGQNAIGQTISIYNDPQCNHFSPISLIGSGIGARLSFSSQLEIGESFNAFNSSYKLSRGTLLGNQIGLEVSKGIVSSIYEIPITAFANYYANKTGW